jgi:hypothetical protein
MEVNGQLHAYAALPPEYQLHMRLGRLQSRYKVSGENHLVSLKNQTQILLSFGL